MSITTRSQAKCCLTGISLSPDYSITILDTAKIMHRTLLREWLTLVCMPLLPDGSLLTEAQISDITANLGSITFSESADIAQVRSLHLRFLDKHLSTTSILTVIMSENVDGNMDYIKCLVAWSLQIDARKCLEFLINVVALCDDTIDEPSVHLTADSLRVMAAHTVSNIMNAMPSSHIVAALDEHRSFATHLTALDHAIVHYAMTGIMSNRIVSGTTLPHAPR